MRTTAKELKKWLENVNDDSFISINTYKNNREKNFIVATQFHDDGKVEEKEFTVSIEDDGFPIE